MERFLYSPFMHQQGKILIFLVAFALLLILSPKKASKTVTEVTEPIQDQVETQVKTHVKQTLAYLHQFSQKKDNPV